MQNLKLGDVYELANQKKEQEFRRLRDAFKNEKQKFEDWEFPPTLDSIGEVDFVKGNPNVQIYWKRPHELVREWDRDSKAKPVFIGPGGVCRFDVTQGGLGDCWYLSSLAQLATEKKLFRVVVPDDNQIGFDDGQYSGAFHFRYWRAGIWTEVVIDDRLPCVKDGLGVSKLIFTTVNNHEFWTVLAEKAFAKLYGTYEQIEGGLQSEALEDFTGGISILSGWDDKTDVEELNEEMKDTMRRAHKRKAFIGLGSKSPEEPEEEGEGEEQGGEEKEDEAEAETGEGEVKEEDSEEGGKEGETEGEGKEDEGEVNEDEGREKEETESEHGIAGGHAYSVTGLEELEDNKGKSHFLLRLRNPWGNYEWTGKWSDSDDESWATVSKDLRGRGTPGAEILGGGCDDGEFWISLEDIIKKYDQMSICYWSPLAYEGRLGQINHPSWDMKMLKGSWSNAETVDPKSNKEDLVKFPVVTVNLSRCETGTDPLFEDCDSSECTMVVALIYELFNRSGPDETMPDIGFRIFLVPQNYDGKAYDVKFFETATEITEEIPMSQQMREINQFFKLEEGTYCIVPFVDYQAPQDGNDPVTLPFLLRIFSERKISVDN